MSALLYRPTFHDHRETIREALEYRLARLLDKVHDDPYYAKSSDWRQHLHRRALAGDIRNLRAALRAVR